MLMTSLLAFDEFELDEARFELRLRGQRLAVQPKVLKLLFYLAARRQRSVSERELLEALWPGETVCSASVRRAVRGARAALGERGDSESAIRTVRRHGYQFVLPVREVTASDLDPKSEHRSTGTPSHGSESPPTAPFVKSVSDPFVGREKIMKAADQALAEVLSGEGRTLTIVGEAGMGKTRTLHEIATRAARLGALTWFGRCLELDGAPAFWPVIQIIRESARDFPADELRALMGAGATDIAQAIPELRQWLQELGEPVEIDSVAARFRFFDSTALFLKRVAERRAIVLLVDDLQRADEPTRRLLEFLVRELERAPVLIAVASRPARPSVGQCDLGNGRSVRTIVLEGMTKSEIARYLELRLRRPGSESAIRWLHEHTAGNPLFMEQILHGIEDLADAEPCWHRLARSAQGLQAAIHHHLEVLSEPCQLMLRMASVLGREFSVGVLLQLTRSPVEHLQAQLTEAVSAGILKTVPDSVGIHRFAHALIREALYEELAPSDRARLHGCAGVVLEALDAASSDTLLGQLAEHFALAGPSEQRRALKYTLSAARAAKQRLAYEQAVLHFDRALELLELEPAAARERLLLLIEKGEALVAAGQTVAARSCLLHAAGIARQLGATRELGAAARLLARAPECGSVDRVQIGLLEQALDALPEDDAQRPCLQALLAKSLIYSCGQAHCARLALDARAKVHELDEPTLLTEVLQACHDALAAPDYLTERVRISDELTKIGHARGDHSVLLRAAATRVWHCVELGDMTAADTAIASMENLSEQVREPFFRWHARAFRAMRAQVEGQLELSERLAHEAHGLGTPLAAETAYHVYCLQMYGIMRLQGRTREAEALVRDISLRHPRLGGWCAVLASIEAENGLRNAARTALERLLERDLEGLRGDPFVLSALAPAAELCAQVGDAALARVLFEATLPYENHHGIAGLGVATNGPMARHLGMLAIRMEDFKRAEYHLKRAISAAQRMPSPLFVSLSSATYARALLLDGGRESRERAAMLVADALEVAKASGLWAVVRLCRTLAERAKLRVPARSTSRLRVVAPEQSALARSTAARR